MRSLYEYVRAGSLDLAIDMCRQSDQSWRAASLAGGQPWWNKTLAAEPFEDDAMMGGADAEHARGNLSRKLWKQMCLKLASSVRHIELLPRISVLTYVAASSRSI